MSKPKSDDLYNAFKTERHLYCVYNQSGKRVLFCDDKRSVDSQKIINELAKSGHKFKVNGKTVAKNKVLEEIEKDDGKNK